MQITRVQHLHVLACNAKLAGSRLLGSKIKSEGLGKAAAVQPPFPTWSSRFLSKNKTAFGTPSYSNAETKEFSRNRLFKVTFVPLGVVDRASQFFTRFLAQQLTIWVNR